MGLNIKLMLHGVPQGQRKWGTEGDDSRYLSSFYGPKWDVPEIMKVELIALGQQTYCYYTFLKGQNVCDVNGRSGSYIALTLKVNAFYADANNIYNLLKAAYEKMCVGTCVSDNGQMVKYLVPDFNDVAVQLEQIESHIISYISIFSVVSDVVSFSQLRVGQDKMLKNINLAECTSAVALAAVQGSGAFLVSPYFLSSSASAKVAQYKETMLVETEKVKADCQYAVQKAEELLAATKEDSQNRINHLQKQFEQDKNSLNKQHEQEIVALKKSYSQFDVERERLEMQIRDYSVKLRTVQNDIEASKKSIKKTLKENKLLNEQVFNLQKKLQKQGVGGLCPISVSGELKKKQKVNRKILFVSVLFVFFLMLLGGLYFGLSRSIQMSKENKELKSQVKTLEDQRKSLNRENTELKKNKNVRQQVPPTSTDTTEVYYSIDIKEFTRFHKYASKGEILTVRIKPKEIPTGKLQCDGLRVKGLKIHAIKTGTFTVNYLVDGKKMASRTIEVKEE